MRLFLSKLIFFSCNQQPESQPRTKYDLPAAKSGSQTKTCKKETSSGSQTDSSNNETKDPNDESTTKEGNTNNYNDDKTDPPNIDFGSLRCY